MLIDASEASRRLGVKPATLYAYVSRGLIRSTLKPGSKAHQYYAVDIERLKRGRRKGRRSGSPPPSYDRYAPVLDTSLCLIEDGCLYYRGVDAIELAATASLEETAALLWNVDPQAQFDPAPMPAGFSRQLASVKPNSMPLERATAMMMYIGAEDVGAFDISAPVVARVGQRLMLALTAALTGKPPQRRPIHEQLARAWSLNAAGADLVRRCLVLSADHELNPSTYVARCVASTGATLYAAVLAALCSLSGSMHGGHILRVEAMLADLLATADLTESIRGRWRRGERLLGFGHPLYPSGDPRARAILDELRRDLPKARTAPILRIADAEFELSGRPPLLDYALASTTSLLRLPSGSAQGIFLIGRSAGWIAHAIEQYAARAIIRPRARYVGPLPVRG
jgi:citrate synthase